MSERAEYLEKLRASGRKKIDLKRLLELFYQVFPEHRQASDVKARLLGVLRDLALERKIGLPSGKQHWQPGNPSAPAWIRLLPESDHADEGAGSEDIWLPQMAFAARLKHPVQREYARRINAFLKERREFPFLVPSRERSLQIFGDEKKLDDLADSSGKLFGGSLTLGDLSCYRAAFPMPVRMPDGGAPGQSLLVVENHHTFESFSRWNAKSRQYTAIGYGAGNAFAAAADQLGDVLERTGAPIIHYFGDLDLNGLRIPARADQKRRAAGMDGVRPAAEWYRWLLEYGIRTPAAVDLKPDDEELIQDWLGEALFFPILGLLRSGRRIPQESLGLDELRARF